MHDKPTALHKRVTGTRQERVQRYVGFLSAIYHGVDCPATVLAKQFRISHSAARLAKGLGLIDFKARTPATWTKDGPPTDQDAANVLKALGSEIRALPEKPDAPQEGGVTIEDLHRLQVAHHADTIAKLSALMEVQAFLLSELGVDLPTDTLGGEE